MYDSIQCKIRAMFLYNNPNVILLVVFVYAGLEYDILFLLVLMFGLPNAFVQKHFKLFFYLAVLGFVTACLSYLALAAWQMIVA